MAPEPKDPAAGSWHFDRRIPLALIGTILLQTGTAVWWASSVNSFIQDTKDNELAIVERVKAVENSGTDADRRLVRFEVLLEGVTDQLKEQRQLLTQIRDSIGPGKK